VGVALCLLSAACFGTLAIFGKLAFEADVNVMTVLCVRFVIAAAIFGGLLAARRADRRRLERRVLWIALGLGAVGYAGQAGLFFAALERMDASLLSLILYAYPALVTLVAVLLGRDEMTPRRTLALLAASSGVALVLVGAGAGGFDPLGAAFGLGAALAYTAYILVAEGVVGRVPPVLLCAVVMTGAAISFGLLSVALGALDFGFEPIGWLWLACMAVVSTVGAMLAFLRRAAQRRRLDRLDPLDVRASRDGPARRPRLRRDADRAAGARRRARALRGRDPQRAGAAGAGGAGDVNVDRGWCGGAKRGRQRLGFHRIHVELAEGVQRGSATPAAERIHVSPPPPSPAAVAFDDEVTVPA
jgi:drug/metabolite transporter (DMT)-like permease